MKTLDIRNVVKRYPNGTLAVKGVNVAVEEGELVVFVGPSGCGKSTLLRMIAGLEDVTEGEIELAGRVVNDIEPAERNIAMVFQNYALYPHMTVRGNLSYGLRNRGLPKDEIARKVAEAARILQIEEYLDRKPRQLSGGQRQRVAMGRAIVRDPAIFLFDEPLSNLDAKLRNQMRLELKQLQRRLRTAAIYVTHDQVEAMTLADRIVVLNAGEVEQIGTPEEVYESPASTFVAGFIGAPPMNLLEVVVEGGVALVGGERVAVASRHAGPAILGIRPERVQIDPEGAHEMEVEAVEELGATRLVHARLGNQPFTITQDAREARPGDRFRVTIPPGEVSLFDRGTGRRI